MKVRIIEKIYHHTNSSMLSTPYRTDRELLWIKELGTAMPCGCNDNIKGVFVKSWMQRNQRDEPF